VIEKEPEVKVPEHEDEFDKAIRLYAVQNNRNSHTIESKIPAAARKMPFKLGIDEAGRGPVCGEIFICLFFEN
jgi:hypothetical protein